MAATLAERIAGSVPDEANVLLVNHGYRQSKTIPELIATINKFIRDKKDDAIYELMNIHPDKEALTEYALVLAGTGYGHRYPNVHAGHPAGPHAGGGGGGGHPAGGGHHHADGFNNCSGCSAAMHRNIDGFNNCTGCGGKCGGYKNADGSTQINVMSAFGKGAFYTLGVIAFVGLLVVLAKKEMK